MKYWKQIAQASVMLAFLSVPALAEPVVAVTLIDKTGPSTGEVPALGMGMTGDQSMAHMGINVNPKIVKRGMVTFKVTNLASAMIHEMIVARLPDGVKMLPYDDSSARVVESALQAYGSVNEIDPSRTAALTLDLKPGKYMLYCNLPGHYMAGMWTVIEVQ
jgi:uncharacterized cupredoxin-like copper-binding protein